MKLFKKFKEIFIVLMILFITGCGLFQTKDICYAIGKVTADQYLKSGTGDPAMDQAVVQVWKAFDSGVNGYVAAGVKPSEFHAYMKTQIKNSGLPPSIQDKANQFLDAAWAKLTANVNVSDEDAQTFLINIQALRDGVKSALPAE